MHVQANEAYASVHRSSLNFGEKVSETQDTSNLYADVKKRARPVIRNLNERNLRVRCFDFATILGVVIAIAVGVVTVILISFQLANNTTPLKEIMSNIQELKETVNAITLELGSIQGNTTNHLFHSKRTSRHLGTKH